ncbi:MAG TPA: CBS domain-containing protein, partial [Terriglobia bacterium]|nr:CBS domain-containing protein [Terriglobia bacterium]
RATASLRERLPRVSFGSRWVERSAVELFQEDIARFPVLLGSQDSEDSLATLRRGEIPRLRALQAYNSTVYRWNRACYGITGGKPHLRIENRVLPAGPTVLDEVANAAFFFGMLRGMIAVYPDVTRLLSFEDVRKNFLSAARDGLDAQFQWINGKSISARSLIAGELVPMARAGLESGSIRRADIERYLGVIEARIPSGRSGAEWSLQSLANMKNTRRETALTTLTAAIAHRQWETPGPAHEWPLAGPAEKRTIKRNMLSIEEAMTTDLSTVHPDEPIDLVVNLMDWRRIRHVPVEDEDGRLAGLVSYFEVIRHLNQRASDSDPVAVRAIMNSNPLTVSPEARVQDAIALMSEKNAACLLVVKDSRLVGIVTEHDVLRLTAELLR